LIAAAIVWRPSEYNNFSVSKATIQGQQTIVQVTLKGQGAPYKLRVTLRRENGAWRIDNVKGSY
jgi:ABC-type transporter MlaC component